MATIDLDLKKFMKVFVPNEMEQVAAVRQAVHEAAILGSELIAQAAPVDVGSLKSSVRVERDGDSWQIVVDAPHAAAVEVGTRPHTPPLQPLIDWVRRHAGDVAKSKIRALAIGLQRKIAEQGTKPRWFVRNTLPKMKSVLDVMVRRALRKRRK
jgi:hypothetical protein